MGYLRSWETAHVGYLAHPCSACLSPGSIGVAVWASRCDEAATRKKGSCANVPTGARTPGLSRLPMTAVRIPPLGFLSYLATGPALQKLVEHTRSHN